MTKLYNKIFPYFIIVFVTLISTLLLWLPFLLKASQWFRLQIVDSSFQYVLRHFDGPLYVIVAKTFYNPNLIENIGLEINLSSIYFAAHLPLYPVLIKVFAPIVGFLKSMIFVNIASTLLLALFLFHFLRYFKLTKNPLILTIVFLLFPRFLILRSVGAPESLFMLLILLSLFFFERKKYLLSGIFGGLSVMTKTPGILLFGVYSLVLFEQFVVPKFFRSRNKDLKSKILNRFREIINRDQIQKFNWRWIGLLLIPLGLFFVFLIYLNQYHDFFAYFHSGDNIHLVAPFAAFNFQKAWVATAWLEDIIFYFFLYGMTVLGLKDSRYRSLFYFSLIFFISILFIEHRDIARYSIPLWPMAVIAHERFFTSRKFLLISVILLPAVFFYGWNFMLYNIMPISNWKPFL